MFRDFILTQLYTICKIIDHRIAQTRSGVVPPQNVIRRVAEKLGKLFFKRAHLSSAGFSIPILHQFSFYFVI